MTNIKQVIHMMEQPDVQDETRSSPCSLQQSRGVFKFVI